ncbi:MAG: alkaline phosphatase D family protein [Planctomycetota bacterium]|jgi:alkaline phosphatase D
MNWRKIFGISAIVCLTLFLFAAAIYAAEQYKQQNREAISQIVDGKHDKAIRHFENYLKKHPEDLESIYGLTVAYSQKKDINKAISYTRQAINAGLPFDRFLAGPRDLLMPLTESAQFKLLAKKHTAELLHGPMLGCVTDSSVKFWVRTTNEVPVQVVVSSSQNMSSPIKSTVVKTNKTRDFTAVVDIENLNPDTQYHYELLVNGRKQPKRWSFRTFCTAEAKAKFQIGFGGGAGYTPWYERMWNTIAAHNPRAFLFLGDNIYIDNPTRPAVQQYCYYRRQSRPEFRNLVASTGIYAIWDDHDFTTNDGWGGPKINEPAWKIPVWRLFRNNWNNPYYGGGENQPGCWFDFSIGDVDFFMLDGRYYRMKSKGDNPSMLGPVQKEWLLKKVKASTATFKVLASPVNWAFGTKPGSRDTWQGYKKEREDILAFLEKNKIDGVILISADRHRSDIWKIDRANGYDLYEFESSKLTNIHTHRLMEAALFGYNKKCSFGLLTFDTTATDPKVTYQIINIDNELIHTFSLLKSQLTHKKANNDR